MYEKKMHYDFCFVLNDFIPMMTDLTKCKFMEIVDTTYS